MIFAIETVAAEDKGAYTKPVDMYLKDVHCIGTSLN